MDREELDRILKEHKKWLNGKGGGRAKLHHANLKGADLSHANIEGADLDYSCLPLWCGSRGMIVDKRIACQIAAHFCALVCDDEEYQAVRQAILPFAKQSHRARELGLEGD